MKWDLTDFFKNSDEWEKAYSEAQGLIENLSGYKGKLSTKLEEFKIKEENLEQIIEDLFVYSRMSSDLDTTNNDNEARYNKVLTLASDATEKLSWTNPEIIELGEEKVLELSKNSEKLKEYKYSFDVLFYSEDHILDKEKEELLSYFSNFNGTPKQIYGGFRYSDNKPSKVKLSTGETVEVSDHNYGMLLTTTENQKDRKKIFEAFFKKYEDYKNTMANVYSSISKFDVASAKARKFESFLHMYLHSDKVPTDVYHNLLASAKNNESVKKYHEIRKRALGIKKYHNYDRVYPLVSINSKYTYKEAVDILLKAIKDLPNDYQEKVKEAMTEGYIEAMPDPKKRSGAYSWGTYTTHPYILLNFDGTLKSVLTLAHEVGHSVHTLYACESQPYAVADYSIFVAEVASTFLEKVVINYIYNNTTDENEKIYLIQKMVDEHAATFYRQTMFADFEYRAHKLVSDGEPITESVLSNIATELYKEYYNIDLENEKRKRFWWVHIPHMYNSPFYVYKYATCHTVSLKLYNDYVEDNSNFENFVNLLKAGGSDYPFDLVLNVGIDLSKRETYDAVNENMKELVEKLDKLIK